MSPPIICWWKLVKHLDCFGDNRGTKDIHRTRAHNFVNAQQAQQYKLNLGIDRVRWYRQLHLSMDTQKKTVLIGCQTWSVLPPNIGSLTAIKGNCRDANLWRSKIWRLSFFMTNNWPSPHWEWLRTLYEVLIYMKYILSKLATHHFGGRNNLCHWLNTCKNAPETKDSSFVLKWA